MAKCHLCKNEYDKTFQVIKDNQTYTFDSFECAIQTLAPQCAHCGCKIIGHGVEENEIFCCANCARQKGATELQDRA